MKIPSYCPDCRSVHTGRCPLRTFATKHNTLYDSRAYRDARQKALEAYDGKCAYCGRLVAYNDCGSWKMLESGAGVDHAKALRDGGTDSVDNLRPLCAKCHASKTASECMERRRV